MRTHQLFAAAEIKKPLYFAILTPSMLYKIAKADLEALCEYFRTEKNLARIREFQGRVEL